MESRKVQKVGYSTLTMSLPSTWVKQNEINPGDLVFIVPEKDGTLKVMPSELVRKEEAEEYIIQAESCSEPGMCERLIIGSYILGRDVVRIRSTTRIGKEHFTEIREIVRKLIGLGILEETRKEVLLQCAVDSTKFKMDMLIRRLSILASTILTDALQGLQENDESLVDEAISREDEADTIYYLAVRLLLSAQIKPGVAEKIGVADTRFLPATRLILQYLELIADYSEDLAKKIKGLSVYRTNLPSNTIENITHLGELAHTIFRKAIECIFSRDLKIANKLLEMKNLLEIEGDELMLKLPQIPYLRAIVSGLNKIADLGAVIATIAINRALEDPEKYAKNIVQVVKHKRTLPLPTAKKH